MTWRAKAACSRMPTSMFYPERGESTEPAKAVCASCPSRNPCLEYALIHEPRGIWGGMSGSQRNMVRKSRGLPRYSMWVAEEAA